MDANNKSKTTGARMVPGADVPTGPHGTIARRVHGDDTWYLLNLHGTWWSYDTHAEAFAALAAPLNPLPRAATAPLDLERAAKREGAVWETVEEMVTASESEACEVAAEMQRRGLTAERGKRAILIGGRRVTVYAVFGCRFARCFATITVGQGAHLAQIGNPILCALRKGHDGPCASPATHPELIWPARRGEA